MPEKEETTLLRLRQIIGDEKNGVPAIIPMSEATWWRGVKKGTIPKPVKWGRNSFWRSDDIYRLVNDICEGKMTGSDVGA